MKVKELIAQLSKLPKDAEVTIPSASTHNNLRTCHKVRTACLMKVVKSTMSWQFIMHDSTFKRNPEQVVVYLTPAKITNNFKFIQNVQECYEWMKKLTKKNKRVKKLWIY